VIPVDDSMVGAIDEAKRRKLILSGVYLWSKRYRRSLFEEPRVRFREHIPVLNDNDIIRYMYFRAKNVYTVKEVFYWYADTPASATKTKSLDAYCGSLYSVMKSVYDLCHGFPQYKGLSKQAIESALTVWYLYSVNRCLYDQIARLGATVDNVPLYFENLDKKTEDMLKRIANLRKTVIEGDFRDNPDVVDSVSEVDLRIIEECDKRYLH
jgi:hypothetical protein